MGALEFRESSQHNQNNFVPFLQETLSGKFATNALTMSLAGSACNLLRFIGQLGLLGDCLAVMAYVFCCYLLS